MSSFVCVDNLLQRWSLKGRGGGYVHRWNSYILECWIDVCRFDYCECTVVRVITLNEGVRFVFFVRIDDFDEIVIVRVVSVGREIVKHVITRFVCCREKVVVQSWQLTWFMCSVLFIVRYVVRNVRGRRRRRRLRRLRRLISELHHLYFKLIFFTLFRTVLQRSFQMEIVLFYYCGKGRWKD